MLVCKFERHHDSPIPEFTKIVSSEGEALSLALVEVLGGNTIPIEKAQTAVDLIKSSGMRGITFDVPWLDPEGKEDADIYFPVSVWYERGTTLNFGVAEGSCEDEVDKTQAVWMNIKKYEFDETRKAQLMALSKEELVHKILTLELES